MEKQAAIAVLVCLSFARVAGAVDCRTETFAGSRFTTCRVEAFRESLRLFYADPVVRYGTFSRLDAALAKKGRKLAFAMNAGMFTPDYGPVGLLVIDGIEYGEIDRATSWGNFYQQPNGVFVIDEAGPRVVATEDYRILTPRFATQSGPMLLHRGQIPANSAMRSTSRHIRNGVCVPEPLQVEFVISEDEVTFREFAEFFASRLKCTEALYFDGSVSSLYSPQLGRHDRRSKFGPIVGVIE
jgi:uncharacterized protein YigE (DUF2233 family)